ncbi:MAG TPA: inositol monophosphatase family protein [Pseudomonadota bacterium]|nr:inositol monophosphatase [Xanthomonadales bacterium]HQY36155.1 inositol monophosphatase family protein [Pseudomonadota bacterium]
MRQGALNIAIKAARAAGAVIVRYLNRVEGLAVVQKEQFDFASEVDRSAEAEIIKEIKRAFPQHAILAEESGAAGSGKHTWVIDPLDGTHNYLRGFPHFAVSIALVENGEPLHGVVYDPIRGELWTASRGAGAFLNDRRIRVSQRTGLGGALLCTGFPFRQRQHLPAHLDMTRALLVEAEDIRRTGSAALDLAYVASGRLDGYWEMGLKPWDMAAGILLVREAGGRCTDFTGGSEFYRNGHIIAANIKVGDAMVAAIAPHLTPALR